MGPFEDPIIQRIFGSGRSGGTSPQQGTEAEDRQQTGLIEQLRGEVKRLRESQIKQKNVLLEQKNALLEQLQGEIRIREHQKEAIVVQLTDEIRVREQQKAAIVEKMQAELKMREHQKDTLVEHLQGEIVRLKTQLKADKDTLLEQLQVELVKLREEVKASQQAVVAVPDSFAADPWPQAGPPILPLNRSAATVPVLSRAGGDLPTPTFAWPKQSGADWPSFDAGGGGSFSLPAVSEATSEGSVAAPDPTWMIEAPTLASYEVAFREADRNQDGYVEGAEAKEVLDKTMLPAEDLTKIWFLADADQDGRLSHGEFICAMHLATRRAQEGEVVPDVLPTELAVYLNPTTPKSETSGSRLTWTLGEEELEHYRSTFTAVDSAGTGFVTANDGKAHFERTGLPVTELSHIWLISDVDGDGNLSMEEFVCAMALVARRQQGAALPQVLPPELQSQASKRPFAPPPATMARLPPTAGGVAASSGGSAWAASAEEIARYTAVFAQVDAAGTGFAGPTEAREVLEKSQLPVTELSSIWQASDLDGDGRLSLPEFVCAMVLVARRIDGAQLPQGAPPAELLASLQAAGLMSRTPSTAGLADSAPPTGAVPVSSNDVWAVSMEELERYSVVFESLAGAAVGGGGTVGPDEGRELLARSRLPRDELAVVWRLADVDGDGRLAPGEFACAMALVARRRKGVTLPTELPPELYHLCTGRAAAPAAGTASSSSTSWAVNAEELDKYRSHFQRIDTAGRGVLGPEEGREVLMSSQLPMEELSHIWELADVNANGHLTLGEFICAMTLVARRRQGMPLPARLPPELTQHLGPAGRSRAAAQAAQAAAKAPAAGQDWALDAEELAKYKAAFERVTGGRSFANRDEANRVMQGAMLPAEEMALIYRLADMDGDSQLVVHEFVCAMALAARRRRGLPLPDAVPPELAQAALAGVA